MTARPVNDSVSALSAVCQRDQFDRSIAAQLNVNMQLVEDSAQWRQFFAPLGNAALTADQVLDHLLPLRLHTQFSMLVQELVHVLGFTVPQFSVCTRTTRSYSHHSLPALELSHADGSESARAVRASDQQHRARVRTHPLQTRHATRPRSSAHALWLSEHAR